MTIYLFYHPDTDGITAAAIVRYAARDRWPDARFEYIRYGYLAEDKRPQTLVPRDSLTLSAWHRRHPELKADGYLVGQLASPQQWKMSLYTAVGSDLDTAQVAAAFGGGGHFQLYENIVQLASFF